MSLIRSISGLRATLGNSLTPTVVADHATAFSTLLPPGPIVVGRDGRPSGVWIADVVVGALRACGRTVRVLDMVPTPTVQLITEHSDAVGGISITASHNPAEWNGLKFLGADGVFLDAEQNTRLLAIADARAFTLSSEQQHGAVEHVSNAAQQHIDAVLGLQGIVKGGKAGKVVVDAVNASGSFIVPRLLRALGYEVVDLACDGSGVFPHAPEPTTENLLSLGEAVRANGADLGIAVDPDADRLVLFDHHGMAIGEEKTVALAAEAVFAMGVRGIAVVNYSTSRMIDDIAAPFGSHVLRAAVGEINVVRRMQQEHAVIGGEGSGGVIYPACHFGRDSLVGIALITSLMRMRAATLADLAASMPSYHMIKTKFAVADRSRVQVVLDRCVHAFADAQISTVDGVHCAWQDRWIHIRASNTEPIMRVIAEAPYQHHVAELIARVQALLEDRS